MSQYSFDATLSFSRDIAADATVSRLEALLRELAPMWSEKMRLWNSSRDQLEVPDGVLRDRVIASATRRGPTYEHLKREWPGGELVDRRFGAAEVRGSPAMTVIIRIDSDPFWRINGAVKFGNRVTLQVRRKTIEGQTASQWIGRSFARLCADLEPTVAWVVHQDEYVEKVHGGSIYGSTVGLDFSRYLPGVFSTNYYGEPYVSWLGSARLLGSPVETEVCGTGVVLTVSQDPTEWSSDAAREREAAVREHLGQNLFRDPSDQQRNYAAPVWITSPELD